MASVPVRRAVGALLCGVAFLIGCDRGSNDAVYFPTWPTSEVGATPLALLKGRLVERQSCLFLAVGATDYLPLWADTFELIAGSPIRVEDESGVVAEVGQTVTLVGGVRTRDQAESLIGADIPDRCQTDDAYWLASELG